jgi:PKHD-type hydroxylase
MQKSHASMYDAVWANQAFSDAECDAILDKFSGARFDPGLLMNQSAPDISSRKSSIRFVPYNADDMWVFDRLRTVATLVNQKIGFELKGFDEGFQLAQYAEGEFYHWHADLGADVSAFRKLSLVVQLTPPAHYDGGELEFFPAPVQAPRDRGTVIVFPSYMPHRVLPVTRGVRWSMASWIAGETPFR